MAIRMFFFLSGFVLGKGYLDGRYNLSPKGILVFYGKRIRRIVPLYYPVVLYLFFLTPVSTPARFADLFHLVTFTATPHILLYSSGYLWFISTLIQLYFLTPAGFLILKFIKAWNFQQKLGLFIFILAFGAVIKWVFLSDFTYEYLYSSWQSNTDIFFAGMMLAAVNSGFYDKIKSNRSVQVLTGALVFLFFPLFYFIGNWDVWRQQYFMIILPIAICLSTAILLSVFQVKRPFSVKNPLFILQITGVYSYEFYLLHQPVLSKLNLSCLPCTLPAFLVNIIMVMVVVFVLVLAVDAVKNLIPAANSQNSRD